MTGPSARVAAHWPPLQRYTTATLNAQHDAVVAATGSGAAVLAANQTAQAALKGEEASGKTMFPQFTSMGFEVEFAQQTDKATPNPLDKAHVEVSRSPGFAMFPAPPFLLETDAARALEFVTPPLLAPLQDKGDAGVRGSVKPLPAWENKAREAIEFSLRDISSSAPRTVADIIGLINGLFPVNLPVPSQAAGGSVIYGDIDKFPAWSHTGAQLNYMTTLAHYMAINRAGPKKDSVTEEIFQLIQKKVDADHRAAFAQYAYVVAQKLREIPSILIDETLSVILSSDTQAPQDKAQQGLVATSKKGNNRKALAFAASTIKDQSVLWLKASLNQLLVAMGTDPEGDTDAILQVIDDGSVGKVLIGTDQSDVLKRYYEAAVVSKFIEDQLVKVYNTVLAFVNDELVESDVSKKPAEQRTMSDERRKIIGARPDTYVKSDPDLKGDEDLFLVETRRTSAYLGLSKGDSYLEKKKAAAKKK